MEKKYFGIDLGTTNSVISYATISQDGKRIAKPVEIEQYWDSAVSNKTTALPSFVYYYTRSDNINVYDHIVGEYARGQYKLYPDRVAKSIKSQMGNPRVANLFEQIPDKTPEAISARILSHLKQEAEKNPLVRQKAEDFVITVPANFGSAQREATLKAAEMAGFPVRTADGAWKPILISEPNAVLYDIAQRYLNNPEEENAIDFSQRQSILIFDMGGGTLDVTIQEVEMSKSDHRLHISEISSARYTKLAGDDFDRHTAECLFKRFAARMKTEDPSFHQEIIDRKEAVIRRLIMSAEALKKEINRYVSNEDVRLDWFDEIEAEVKTFSIGEDIGNGRWYSDRITTEEYEAFIHPLLGCELCFDDYRNASKHRQAEGTIISPILDALAKASAHYRTWGRGLKIDAVVMNGGMSRMHWIQKRLREFFGFEIIVTKNPTLSVANGAAVYASILAEAGQIDIVRQIQNETLYLGFSAGARELLIEDQAMLPFQRSFKDYKLVPHTKSIAFPIQKQIDSDHYQNVARCVINLGKTSPKTASISFTVLINENQLLSISATLTSNSRPLQTLQSTIELNESDRFEKYGNKVLPHPGAQLHATNELNALKDLCRSGTRNHRPAPDKIKARFETIICCGNPECFESPVLQQLERANDTDSYMSYLLKIAESLSPSWSDNGQARLKTVANNLVKTYSSTWPLSDRKSSTRASIIQTAQQICCQ